MYKKKFDTTSKKLSLIFILSAFMFSITIYSQQDNIQQVKEKAKSIYSKMYWFSRKWNIVIIK